MTDKPAACVQIEDDLLATAMGEAGADAAQRVERHIARCASCRRDFHGYHAVETVVAALRAEPSSNQQLRESRGRLDTRLADLRSRMLVYRIFPSPLGNILIARSELGISLVEYLERRTGTHSPLIRDSNVEMIEGGEDLETVYRELLEYLDGRRTHLAWPLDLRLVRSEFQREVLSATAAIPYGAVKPYAGIAREIGKSAAVRAVAQALRWNPLPIVIPCHRVIGMSGALTGYAGNKVGLKHKLLSVEGVPTAKTAGEFGIAVKSMYVLYPGDREYCVPTCPSLDTREPTPLMRFASRERAEAAGFAPCTTCRPDLHPISH